MSRIGLHGAVASGRRALLLGIGLSAAGCGLLVGAKEITLSANGTGGGGGMAAGPGGAGGAAGTGGGMGGYGGAGGGCFSCFDPRWVQDFRGMGEQIINDVAVDSYGNVVIVGSFEQTGTFTGPCEVGGPCEVTSNGGKDLFIIKLDEDGKVLWGKLVGDADPTRDEEATDIIIDNNENIIVAGIFKGSIDFGGGVLTSASTTTYDIFLAKFDPNGQHIWSTRFGDASNQFASDITFDSPSSSGDIILTGYYQGTIDFGGGNLPSTADFNTFVTRITASGVHSWSQSFGASGNQLGLGAATDAGDNIIIVGRFDGTINFGGPDHIAAGTTDLFIAKLTPSGSYTWSKSFGDSVELQEARAIAVNSQDDVLITGRFAGTLDFITGDNHQLVSTGSYDSFITKLSGTDGNAIWSRSFGGAGDQVGDGIALFGDDEVYITGSMSGTATFAGQDLVSEGGLDMYIIRYGPNGTELCGTRYGDSASQTGTALAVHGIDIIAVGNHQGTVDLGCMTTATSAGGNDALIAKLRIPF